MELNKHFAKYKNKFIDVPVAVIMGSGKTLNEYKKIDNAIHICVKAAAKVGYADFIICHDLTHDKYEDVADEVFNNPCKYEKFFGIGTWNYKQPEFISKKYPEIKYFDSTQNPYIDIENHGLWDNGSSIFPAVHFALYAGFQKIYLVGCDCTNLYFSENVTVKSNLSYLVNFWIKFKEWAYKHYPNTTIMSINPIGLIDIFPTVKN